MRKLLNKRNMKIIQNPSPDTWAALTARPVMDFAELEGRVAPILEAVRQRGDAALRELTQRFDGAQLQAIAVSEEEVRQATAQVGDTLKQAIRIAAHNIRSFHAAQAQAPQEIETTAGVRCWRRSLPIEKVGLYIPGGTAPLFSTVLMLAIPAQLAGCTEVVLCTPPNREGKIHPAILYAARQVGVTQIFKVGGAQAIAAMAFGTESIPQVYKLFGPGNQYVTVAKQLLSRLGIAIDMPAGPSEVAVIADAGAPPAFVAADLLSQAEHGVDSQSILLTTQAELAEAVAQEVDRQLARLPRREMAAKSLQNSRLIVLPDWEQVVAFANQYAAEHLIVATADARTLAAGITCAGSIFLGYYTPESAGDYASGTNHTLPTNGYARAWSGVSLDSFVKKVTYQEISPEGLANLGPVIETLAEAEELIAHKNAVSLRLAQVAQDV